MQSSQLKNKNTWILPFQIYFWKCLLKKDAKSECYGATCIRILYTCVWLHRHKTALKSPQHWYNHLPLGKENKSMDVAEGRLLFHGTLSAMCFLRYTCHYLTKQPLQDSFFLFFSSYTRPGQPIFPIWKWGCSKTLYLYLHLFQQNNGSTGVHEMLVGKRKS